MAERFTIDERQLRVIAWTALPALTLIVASGATVRLTDSGPTRGTIPEAPGPDERIRVNSNGSLDTIVTGWSENVPASPRQ